MVTPTEIRKEEAVELKELTEAFSILRNPPAIFSSILPNPKHTSKALLLDAKRHAYNIYELVKRLMRLNRSQKATISLTLQLEEELKPALYMRGALERIEGTLSATIQLAATPNYVQACQDFDIVIKRLSELMMSIRRALELQRRAKAHLNAILHVEMDEEVVLKELLGVYRQLVNVPSVFNEFLKRALRLVEFAEQQHSHKIKALTTLLMPLLRTNPAYTQFLMNAEGIPDHLAVIKRNLESVVSSIQQHENKVDSFARFAESLRELQPIATHLGAVITALRQLLALHAQLQPALRG